MNKVGVLPILLFSLQMTACANNAPNEIEALYTWGEGVNSVYVCSEAKEYWVDSQAPTLKKLETEYLHLVKSPYEPIFIVFKGSVIDAELDGFATNYDGLMRVDKVIQLGGAIPERCLDKK